ncbi:uncharacterized protein LOC118537897 isoform X1 [Halichoerus grypus]
MPAQHGDQGKSPSGHGEGRQAEFLLPRTTRGLSEVLCLAGLQGPHPTQNVFHNDRRRRDKKASVVSFPSIWQNSVITRSPLLRGIHPVVSHAAETPWAHSEAVLLTEDPFVM